jgi:hypothetical protein
VVPAAIPDWPASFTNGELIDLAKRYKAIAEECNADKDAIAKDAGLGPDPNPTAEPIKPAPAAGRPWWKFWN